MTFCHNSATFAGVLLSQIALQFCIISVHTSVFNVIIHVTLVIFISWPMAIMRFVRYLEFFVLYAICYKLFVIPQTNGW